MVASQSTVGPDDSGVEVFDGSGFDWQVFAASKDPREHTHELPNADGSPSRVYCIETHMIGVAGQGDVWCSLCDKPATKEILLSTGETVGRCSLHAWLLK
jgi:hypothetical protein